METLPSTEAGCLQSDNSVNASRYRAPLDPITEWPTTTDFLASTRRMRSLLCASSRQRASLDSQ